MSDLHAHTTAAHASIDKIHDDFTKWALKHDIQINNVGPANLPGRGIGLVAQQNIRSRQLLVCVPVSAMAKPTKNEMKKIGMENASPQAQLAASLMWSMHADPAQHEPWRAVWPTMDDFEQCMPITWSAKLLGLLPDNTSHLVKRQQGDFERDYKSTAHANSALGAIITRRLFRYYWLIANTRSFHWKAGGFKGTMVICPYFDYMNHCTFGTGCHVNQTSTGYELVADRDYVPGEEICASYGPHSNDKLLIHYGFVLPLSPAPTRDDEVRLDHLILPRLTTDQRSTLEERGFLGGYAIIPAANEICFKTQVALRILLFPKDVWEHFISYGEDPAGTNTSTKADAFLLPLLVGYEESAQEKLRELTRLERDPTYAGHGTAFGLIRVRWEQIISVLDAIRPTIIPTPGG
ncbi:hypothetical protein LTR66_000942 [Elasticomyces elasticus]|nr:hypothetical protein LTR66_000942 [Elasticomyces elasticus]